jgi:TFIIH basal transcription factor complex TTD-A subunit
MPRAIRGMMTSIHLPAPFYHPQLSQIGLMYCYPGVLVQCDPSIKSIIVKIDSEKNDFIVEELDDQTLVIKEGMLQILKMRLNEVDFSFLYPSIFHFQAGFSYK